MNNRESIFINMFKKASIWNSNYDAYQILLKAEVD